MPTNEDVMSGRIAAHTKNKQDYQPEDRTPKSYKDVKNILKELIDISNTEIQRNTVSTKLKWEGEGKSGVDNISTEVFDFNLFKVLMEGLGQIKKIMDSVDKTEEMSTCWDVDKMYFPVDTLIQRRLFGKRIGLRIRWEVRDGVFEFDPYTKKLYEIEEESNGQA